MRYVVIAVACACCAACPGMVTQERCSGYIVDVGNDCAKTIMSQKDRCNRDINVLEANLRQVNQEKAECEGALVRVEDQRDECAKKNRR
jgi:hypothetical protein